MSYYEKHPLYRKVRLRYPVTEEIVRQRGVVRVSLALLFFLAQAIIFTSAPCIFRFGFRRLGYELLYSGMG